MLKKIIYQWKIEPSYTRWLVAGSAAYLVLPPATIFLFGVSFRGLLAVYLMISLLIGIVWTALLFVESFRFLLRAMRLKPKIKHHKHSVYKKYEHTGGDTQTMEDD